MSHSLLKLFLTFPQVREFLAEAKRAGQVEALLSVLEGRFGPVPSGIRSAISGEKNTKTLFRLIRPAALCVSLEEFENSLHQEQQAASTKRKRRSRKPPA